jgi:lipopolysaccharide export LptBFGC system permease protein LptF
VLNAKKPKTAIIFGAVFVLFGIAEMIFSPTNGAGKVIFAVVLVVPGLLFIAAGMRALTRDHCS